MNQSLGAMGRTLETLPADAFAPEADGDLEELVEALKAGAVEALVVMETNPVYTAPGDLDVAGALDRAELAVHLGGQVEETAALCDWHVPPRTGSRAGATHGPSTGPCRRCSR